MDTICWCNACYARRFPYGADDRRKFDDCDAQQALDYAFAQNAAAQPVALDAVVEANRKLLLERSNVGVAKYGVTLAASGLSRRALLQHALEEALDLANYLQAELMRLDSEGEGNG
jgi:hypothetical protein